MRRFIGGLWGAFVSLCAFLLVVGGILAFVAEGNNHSACSSALVQAASPSQCQTDNTIYYAAIAAIVLGALAIGERIWRGRARPNRRTEAPPPGWYRSPNRPGIEQWWDGEKYTHERVTSAASEGAPPQPG